LGQVAIYCRVSTDDQSCEHQERDLRAFAKRARHGPETFFAGSGISHASYTLALKDLEKR